MYKKFFFVLNLIVVLSLAVCGHAEPFAACVIAEVGI
jgi:hypothetical protein